MQAGAIRALADWVTREPIERDLEKYSSGGNPGKYPCTICCNIKNVITSTLATLADFIFPFPCATIQYDFDKENYPNWLCAAIINQTKTGATKGEWFVTLGSIFILAVTLVRTLCTA